MQTRSAICLFRGLCAGAALLLLQACSHHVGTMSATQRNTSFGPVAGTDDRAATGTFSWKGVPFARAPVGPLRWRAPVDPERWTTARRATDFGPACVQTGRLYGPGLNNRYDATIGATLGQTLGSEDCLTLNIWEPAARSVGPRPVIVWVYGGSNITGYTADPVYDGANLARTADAVVVSVNYRLGIFGFLDLAQLKPGVPAEDSGNFALLDLVKALEFVQKNIASFGGDPGRVTLMGESAGAVNVYALMTSPMLSGKSPQLFHRVVALSGGLSTAATLPPGSIPGVLPSSVWATRGQALLAHSLMADGTVPDEAAAKAYLAARTPQQIAEYLRGKSPDALLTTVRTRLAPLGMAASNPIADGTVVATDPIAGVRAGRYAKVPVLAGSTRDETKLFPGLFALRPSLGGASGRLIDDARVFSIAYKHDPDGPPATRIEDWIPAQYLPVNAPVTGFNARAQELNRIWFMAIRDDMLNALQTQQSSIWLYQFDWDELPRPFDDIFGAAHAFDLPFVFGNFGPSLFANISFTKANRPGRMALSEAMMKSLGAFAHSGDPNHPALGTPWRPWPSRIVFDATPEAARISAR
ncbi:MULTISPECIES: carboxylesterase family protein [unclassified Variovorax]|uniref:carboxylesterase/lipase family protein n=2 Tax=Variovorax TaxID=34072 RepID=UPI00076D1C9D|nr:MULTISPECIES: carboxylesterase family protein [unclassified Variovorax]KWT98527.1 Carboxylesterase, type B [Variovorax sp. WDL1]PNG56821.1 Para-nitrobenzyl esterase [Variovorax sp. B4]PNG58245.1 Para-nitrobenzyl esterase [Variovorax sp. B2]VTV09236.1 Para-nitrobenzyl esterase [Variovorax sp. WDL1]